MEYPTSIDISRSESEIDIDGGWMDIFFDHTFPPLAGMDGKAQQDGQSHQGEDAIKEKAAASRPMLSPVQLRQVKCQAGAT